MQALRQLRQFFLRVAAIRRQKSLAPHVVTGIERILHRLPGEHAAFLLIPDAECRIDAQRFKMLAQEISAKAMQR